MDGFHTAARPLKQIEAFIKVPEHMVDLLFRFLNRNGDGLSRCARSRKFKGLTEKEPERIEAIYQQVL